VSSEKYGGLLLIDLQGRPYVKTVRVGVPRHAELEGVALVDGGVLLCDEAHAAVYEVLIDNEEQVFAFPPAQALPAEALTLEGVAVRGGKIGFEGIEVDENDGTVYLLLERSGTEETGCVSRIWSLHRTPDGLRADGDPIEVALEDCTWRLTGLAWTLWCYWIRRSSSEGLQQRGGPTTSKELPSAATGRCGWWLTTP